MWLLLKLILYQSISASFKCFIQSLMAAIRNTCLPVTLTHTLHTATNQHNHQTRLTKIIFPYIFLLFPPFRLIAKSHVYFLWSLLFQTDHGQSHPQSVEIGHNRFTEVLYFFTHKSNKIFAIFL